jgi:hypothetical protein
MNAPRNVLNNRTVFNRARSMPDRFMDGKYRASRENHTQKKYAPLAIAASLAVHNRWKPPMARPRHMSPKIDLPRPHRGALTSGASAVSCAVLTWVGVRGQAPTPNEFMIQETSFGRKHLRSHSTLRLNRSHVKHKPAARGRMQ